MDQISTVREEAVKEGLTEAVAWLDLNQKRPGMFTISQDAYWALLKISSQEGCWDANDLIRRWCP